MTIERVLNTNAVLSRNGEGEEIILLGAGIGFKQKPGGEVDMAKAEKCFVMGSRSQQDRFQQLLESIPQEYIMVAEQIISLAKNVYNMTLAESIHISLADHIHTAVINLQSGVTVPNSLLLDLQQLYANEYEVGSQALFLVKEALGFQLPRDEAGYIAMHLVNAQYGTGNSNIKRLIDLVQDLNTRILRELGVDPDTNSLNYYRYMTHLKFFAQRILQDRHYNDDIDGFFDTLLAKYPREYQCSRMICRYVEKVYHYTASHDEIIYLTVHLAHISR
jgi:beta-glucoside operon transcriptional antiterminator